MATRTFLIPMQAPANGTGKGTRADPWRPKYLLERGLDFSIVNARDFCLAHVTGDDAALDALEAEPDVIELPQDDQEIRPGKQGRMRAMLAQAGIAELKGRVNRDVIKTLRESIHDFQRANRPSQALRDAVLQRRRSG